MKKKHKVCKIILEIEKLGVEDISNLPIVNIQLGSETTSVSNCDC